MRRIILAVICTSAVGIAVPALAADGETTPVPAPPAATPAPAPEPCVAAKRIWAEKRWRKGPIHAKACETTPAALRKLKHEFYEYRTYRRVAPFRGPGFGGPREPDDGRWWAIPWYIVCGESGGRFYPSENSDGAYQIIPSTWIAFGGGRFSSTANGATPLQQHIVAHAAYGRTPWYGAC